MVPVIVAFRFTTSHDSVVSVSKKEHTLHVVVAPPSLEQGSPIQCQTAPVNVVMAVSITLRTRFRWYASVPASI